MFLLLPSLIGFLARNFPLSNHKCLMSTHISFFFVSVCSTWPAFWTANLANWPNGGEIDIIEGVNDQWYNHWSMHTGGTCSQSGPNQSGWTATTNCNVNAAGQSYNTGCAGWSNDWRSYGDGMNDVGGGVYAMDWRSAGIRIWFWPAGSVPSDITSGKPTTSGWGTVLFLISATFDSLCF